MDHHSFFLGSKLVNFVLGWCYLLSYDFFVVVLRSCSSLCRLRFSPLRRALRNEFGLKSELFRSVLLDYFLRFFAILLIVFTFLEQPIFNLTAPSTSSRHFSRLLIQTRLEHLLFLLNPLLFQLLLSLVIDLSHSIVVERQERSMEVISFLCHFKEEHSLNENTDLYPHSPSLPIHSPLRSSEIDHPSCYLQRRSVLRLLNVIAEHPFRVKAHNSC
jgi:hypothetical protein